MSSQVSVHRPYLVFERAVLSLHLFADDNKVEIRVSRLESGQTVDPDDVRKQLQAASATHTHPLRQHAGRTTRGEIPPLHETPNDYRPLENGNGKMFLFFFSQSRPILFFIYLINY